jgi:hypothetical protein
MADFSAANSHSSSAPRSDGTLINTEARGACKPAGFVPATVGLQSVCFHVDGSGSRRDEGRRTALGHAAGAGFVHRGRSRAKHGGAWRGATPRGQVFLAQSR